MLEVRFDQTFSKAASETAAKSPKRMIDTLYKAGYEVERPAVTSAHALFNHPSGNLPSSIHTVVDKSALEARVGTNLVYARIREFGGVVSNAWGRVTAHHTGRPYLIPAFRNAIPKIREIFAKMGDEVVKDLSKGSKH